MEKYSFKCLPEEFDVERVARENDEDGSLAFMVIKGGEVIVGVKEKIDGFSWMPKEKIYGGYCMELFKKRYIDLLIGNIERVIESHKKTQKQTYKVLTWK